MKGLRIGYTGDVIGIFMKQLLACFLVSVYLTCVSLKSWLEYVCVYIYSVFSLRLEMKTLPQICI